MTPALPVDANGAVTFGDTMPPSLVPPEQTPSTAYRQEVVMQQQPQPHVSSDNPEHTFWVHRNLERALQSIADSQQYAGRIVHSTGQTAVVEENLIAHDAVVLPTYIAAQPVYTEHECRDIVRQICYALQLLHEQHVVHRTLHLNHIAVTPEVRTVKKCGMEFK